MARPKPAISDAELEVLKVLWASGPGTVGDVEADRSGTAHVFRSAVSREELLSHGLATLADRVCDGTASPLVLALVKGQRLSRDEIAELRRLLDDLDRKK